MSFTTEQWAALRSYEGAYPVFCMDDREKALLAKPQKWAALRKEFAADAEWILEHYTKGGAFEGECADWVLDALVKRYQKEEAA